MTHVITSKCKRDATCTQVCPVECIVPGKPTQQWPTFYIDPDTCIDCGACLPECPNAAIYPEEEIPEHYVADIERNSDYFRIGIGYAAMGDSKTIGLPPQFTRAPVPKGTPVNKPYQRTSVSSTPAPRPQGRIFISYKHEDWKPYVKPLVDYLRNQGFSVWVDQHLIEGGRDWQDEINAALQTCAVMILCVTPRALQSAHIKTEYRYFYNHRKILIPLMCENVELPPELQGIQFIYYQNFDALQRLLRQRLSH